MCEILDPLGAHGKNLTNLVRISRLVSHDGSESIMITFDSLCRLAAGQSASSVLLRQACTLPRSPADQMPLPLPGAEFAFDSSWEAIFAGTDMVDPLSVSNQMR